MRRNRDIVSRLDFLAGGKADSISLNNLLGHGLGVGRAGEAGEGVETSGSGIVLKLRVRGVLPSRSRRGVGAAVLGCSYAAWSRTRNEHPGLQPRASAGIEGNGSLLETSQMSESGFSDSSRGAHTTQLFFAREEGEGADQLEAERHTSATMAESYDQEMVWTMPERSVPNWER